MFPIGTVRFPILLGSAVDQIVFCTAVSALGSSPVRLFWSDVYAVSALILNSLSSPRGLKVWPDRSCSALDRVFWPDAYVGSTVILNPLGSDQK